MQHRLCLGDFLCFTLCMFFVNLSCAQNISDQQTTDVLHCPDDTRCFVRGRCRSSLLRSLNEPPKSCGLSYSGRQRICCPVKPPSSSEVPNTGLKMLPQSDCGTVPRVQDFTFRKHPVKQGDYPWMVAITMRTRTGSYNGICTGALITRRHVLSAASCFRRKDPTLYIARIGNVNYKLSNEYSIRSIEVPDSYRRGKFYDDIAVLTLIKDVDAEPICLPQNTQYIDLSGKDAKVIAWGTNPHDRSMSDELYEYPAFRIVSNSECNSEYNTKLLTFRRTFSRGITDEFYCASAVTKDTCLYNGGGPLMHQNQGHLYVIGISSFGVGGCELPDGYTRVTKYLRWIHQKIDN